MKKKSIGICFIIIFTTFLILDIACQKEEDNTGIVVKKEKLTGIVQKGPYTEAFISLYELNPTLHQTGKKFSTQITTNNGSFEIDNVALSSQYAELKANGYYYNEVTGDISSYHLTLSAISDIKDISRVNINLLTHLENERVKYLVEKGGNFTEAKDTAQNEILSIFGFRYENMGKPEKLDISVNKEENAILLAISIMLLGDRSARDLIELLNFISTDLRQDGKFDNDSILQKLRSSTVTLDLAKIRSNLENRYKELGISASIPDFEKYVNIFLTHTGLAPSAETLEAENISSTGATLNGTVKANDLSTNIIFEYGTTSSYGSTLQTSPAVVTGHALTAVSAALTGLNPATVYHFRIKTINSLGTVYGSDLTFTTLGKIPEAQTQAATNISTEGVTLNGTINANDLSTTVTFEYGPTEAYGSTISATPGQVTGHENSNVSSVVTGLTIGTVFHFRIKAVNSLGTVYGSDITFTTLGRIPTGITLAATNILTDGATLNGTVNANDLSTTVSFEYGKTETYGSTISAIPGQVTGHEYINVSSVISGLTIGTTYHFRIKTVNSLGTVYGSDLTFTTLGKIPTAVTRAATNLTTEGAILNGTINANDLSTNVTFEYGTTETYGSTVSATPGEVTGHVNTDVSSVISDLIYNSVYHFRVKTVNALGTVYGSDLTFKTLGDVPSVTTNKPSAIKGTSATLNGIVNANYLSTDVTFEYGESMSYGNSLSAVQSPVNGGSNTYVSVPVSGLIPETLYHFRIKAVNLLGYSYGNDLTFKTPPALIYDIDGNTYTAVAIGNQVWMAENLRATRFNDNTSISVVTDNTQWAGLTTPGYCWYNNDETTYKSFYGALYNWHVVDTMKNGGKNVCPLGWHIPSNIEWRALISYIGGDWSGEKIMETGTSHWPSPNAEASNETGFTGLPGGYRASLGDFYLIGNFGYFITSSYTYDYIDNYGSWFRLAAITNMIIIDYVEKGSGSSIRCIKNK